MEKKKRELSEELNLIQLTPEDQATNIRALIKSCWDSVDQYTMFAEQLREFGNQQALETVNCLINDLYIAIGSFEGALGNIDPKSNAIDTPAQVDAVVQVAPQALQPLAAPVQMIEKFTLSEEDILTEELEEKPEAQQELEEPIEKELKEVEKYRKDKVKDSLNPDAEDPEDLNESVEDDDSYNPLFYKALLQLED